MGRCVSRRRQRLLPAYVAAVIFGIFGMHAFMQHCPAPPGATATTSAATQTVAHHADEDLFAVTAWMEPVIGTVQLTEHAGGGLGDMLMLCAAILLGAGALLTLMLRRRVSRSLALLRLRLNPWRPPGVVASTGPPPTLAFAVIRC